MKRWVVVTVALYAAVVATLVVPLFMLAGDSGDWLVETFFPFFLPVLVLVQIALLLVPVAAAEGRPVGRRTIVSSAIAMALPMAVLGMAIVLFILDAALGESENEFMWGWPGLLLIGGLWLAWGLMFYRRYSAADPGGFTANMVGWLLKGSILEMVVAIPTHIITRQRGDCCAPAFTMLGLATGLSIALMAFGPGVFLLFAKRFKDKRRAH